jgi:hypothetical protein
MTASLDKALRDLATTTIRVQPVDPPERSNEEIGKLLGKAIVLGPAALALSSWFLMLAMSTVHDLFPAAPSVGFWQAVTLILGLSTVANILRPHSWKWARR